MSLVGITRVGITYTGITRMLDQQGRYRQWPASCGHQARGPITVLPLTPPSSSGVWANHSPSPHPTILRPSGAQSKSPRLSLLPHISYNPSGSPDWLLTERLDLCYSKRISIKCSSTATHGQSGAAINYPSATGTSPSGRRVAHGGTGNPTNGNPTSSNQKNIPSHTSGPEPGTPSISPITPMGASPTATVISSCPHPTTPAHRANSSTPTCTSMSSFVRTAASTPKTRRSSIAPPGATPSSKNPAQKPLKCSTGSKNTPGTGQAHSPSCRAASIAPTGNPSAPQQSVPRCIPRSH